MDFRDESRIVVLICSLIFSVVIHGLFLALNQKWGGINLFKEEIIEVTLREKKDFEKMKIFVEDIKLGKILQEKDIKKPSNYVSKFFRRFNEERIAAIRGKQLINVSPFFKSSGELLLGEEKQGVFNLEAPPQWSVVNFDLPGVKKGLFTALNLDPFKFYAFFSRMKEQVVPRWQFNLVQYLRIIPEEDLRFLIKQSHRDQLKLRFEVVLSPEGYHRESIIHRSFGVKELDHVIIDAVEEAAPLLNPPKDLVSSESGKVHLFFGFNFY